MGSPWLSTAFNSVDKQLGNWTETIILHPGKWLLSEHTYPTTEGVGSQSFNRREDKELYCIQKKVEKCLRAARSRWITRQDW